jgi:putative NIF3 family GTP cyclohydrolase 1 type 2
MFPAYSQGAVLKALKESHPYEEVAYYLHQLENKNQYVGSGMIGELENEMQLDSFLKHLKEKFELQIIKHTPPTGNPVKKVAVCGGSGSFLLSKAKNAGADVFVTADFKYHEYFDAEGEIIIADIGHYESECFTIDLLGDFIRDNFTTFATRLTKVNTNPIHYF